MFSCYGRVHPEVVAIFRMMAQVAARKHALFDSKGLLTRLYRNIGVEIRRRATSIVYENMLKGH